MQNLDGAAVDYDVEDERGIAYAGDDAQDRRERGPGGQASAAARLDELKGRARIKGFRPGHVPKEHLRKVYGRSVMAEVVQQAVAETSREALSQREERPAFQPTVALPEDEAEIALRMAASAS